MAETAVQRASRLQAERDKVQKELEELRSAVKEIWDEWNDNWCSDAKSEIATVLSEHGVNIQAEYRFDIRLMIKVPANAMNEYGGVKQSFAVTLQHELSEMKYEWEKQNVEVLDVEIIDIQLDE